MDIVKSFFPCLPERSRAKREAIGSTQSKAPYSFPISVPPQGVPTHSTLVALSRSRARIPRHQPASHRSLRCHLPVHISLAFQTSGRDPPGLHHHFNPQLISRHHWTPESRLLDPRKHHQHLVAVRNLGQQQQPSRLRDCFHYQHARHDRLVWKVSLKKGLGNGHVFQRDNALHPHQFDNAVDQKKWIAMGQDLENIANIHPGFHRLWFCRRRVCGVSHAVSFMPFSSRRRLYCSASFYKLRCPFRERITMSTTRNRLHCTIILIPILLGSLLSSQLWSQQPQPEPAQAPQQSAVPALPVDIPSTAERYPSPKMGNPAEKQAGWTATDATLHIFFQFSDRGRGPKTTSILKVGPDGIPISEVITGNDYLKSPVNENYRSEE